MRAFALNEFRSIELAQHRADISTRAEMSASLGARDQALNRTHAELEVATFRASAEMHRLSRAREAEVREYADAQRHREAATEAENNTMEAQAEADRVRLLSESHLRETAKIHEEELAARSANLRIEAEAAVRRKIDRCEQEVRDEKRKLGEDMAAF